MIDPGSFLDIAGNISEDTSNGYTRLFADGVTMSHFVGVETAQIQPGSVVTPALSTGNAIVPISSRLAISDYPSLPPPLDLGAALTTPIVDPFTPPNLPVVPIGIGGPPRSSFQLKDGTALNVTEEDGRVIGLSGVSADGHTYSLANSISVGKGQVGALGPMSRGFRQRSSFQIPSSC